MEDHERLADTLKALGGRFILTLTTVRRCARYDWVTVTPVDLCYIAGGTDRAKSARELVITAA